MEKVLESNVSVKDEAAWNEMFAAARIKSDKNRNAELSNKKAVAAITNVLESVAAGRNNKMTAIANLSLNLKFLILYSAHISSKVGTERFNTAMINKVLAYPFIKMPGMCRE